ncbi:MAG TPA: dienelactone hydrolase family protein [Bosea sp. (in: a-proteobacteria)]|jgi:dienelactone hydrolase|uniref:dienelactone hydrolase family protein n=1 Tax=Bosea sp. (in: a-proteobacteria) TaxID=1871050 RepID=UPI002E11EB5B|nr:dienelactone hydrolase family protein [Bosea sp. (in: a-proteobacteria)]
MWLLRSLVAVFLGLAAPAQALEQVAFASRDGTKLSGWLAKPEGAGPFPAVVILHGCAGLWNASGKLGARDADWTARLVGAGYAVLLPDSFRPRGVSALCNDRDRSLTPADRAQDALGARDWLAGQAFIASGRVGLIGWSNGGSTVLEAAGKPAAAGPGGFRTVIAFYPGCRVLLRRGWTAQVPTTILHGLADDWTPAEPCERLAGKGGARFVGYAGAYHDFDHPSLPLRERKAAYSERADGMVTLGTQAEARTQAIAATMAILKGM